MCTTLQRSCPSNFFGSCPFLLDHLPPKVTLKGVVISLGSKFFYNIPHQLAMEWVCTDGVMNSFSLCRTFDQSCVRITTPEPPKMQHETETAAVQAERCHEFCARSVKRAANVVFPKLVSIKACAHVLQPGWQHNNQLPWKRCYFLCRLSPCVVVVGLCHSMGKKWLGRALLLLRNGMSQRFGVPSS